MSNLRRLSGTTATDPYTLDRLAELYPHPLVVSVGKTAPAGAPLHARYLLLPGPGRPRIVVPAGRPHAAARAASRQLSGSRMRTRLSRVAVTGAVRSGALEVLTPLQVSITGPPDSESIETALADCLDGARILLTMPVGPARANRKPVLQVTDRTGGVKAFVKIGHDDLTRALIRREASALRGMDRSRLTTTRAPEVLDLIEWSGLTLLVLAPLSLPKRSRRGADASQRLIATVREIGGLTAEGAAAPGSDSFYLRLHEQLRGCGARGAALLGHLEAIEPLCARIRLAPWHGDLNPGNLAIGPGCTLVWDWERFDAAVPFGFDLLHHHLARAITVRGEGAGDAAVSLLRNAREMLAPLGIPVDAAHITARLYLLTLAARYLHDNQDGAGATLGRVEQWILPALDTDRLEAREAR